jgi:AcrR family transcriptional regulator
VVMPAAAYAPTRRQRLRARTLDEIVEHALSIVDRDGSPALTLAAIAKAMGMSVAGLYRYFASRDELVRQLLRICHEQLANTLEQCASAAAHHRPDARLRTLAMAYRAWAQEHPRRYEMMFEGRALNSIDLHFEVGVEEAAAAGRGLGVVVALLAEIHGAAASSVPSKLDQQLGDSWRRGTGQTAAPAALHRAVITWTRLHGIVSLEGSGAFAAMGVDPALLVESEIEAMLALFRQ